MKHNTTPQRRPLFWIVALSALLLTACPAAQNEPVNCGDPTTRCAPPEDMSDATPGQDMAVDLAQDMTEDVAPIEDATPDMAPEEDATPDLEQDMGPAAIEEVEPNGGASVDEFNPIAVNQAVTGAIGEPGDRDIYKLEATPGSVYEVTVTPSPGSMLDAHLTVIDAGRGGDAAGEDYVKIDASEARADAKIQVFAMGEGGYFLALRDQRDVDGSPSGSAEHTYTITVREVDPNDITGQALTSPADFMDMLGHAGDVRAYPFMGNAGQELDVVLTADAAQLDARLYVWSRQTGSWIARNDSCLVGERDPCLAAPLTASGDLMLIVENIEEGATQLGYSVRASWE